MSKQPAAELTTFSCKECYVYQIPPAGTVGHRAANWDVDHWLQAVALAVVAAGDDCYVRLFDKDTGDLFAECPIPEITLTAVEPVVDSSRYFVVRVVDRQTKRHAFIGIGFRERTQASDFNAALHDHAQYLQRQKQAEERRAAYEAEAEASPSGAVSQNLSLKPGETIRIKLGGKDHEPSSGITRLRPGTQPAVPLFSSTSTSGVPCLGPPPQRASPKRSPGAASKASPATASGSQGSPSGPPPSRLRVSGEFGPRSVEPTVAPASATAAMECLQIGGHPDTSSKDQVEKCSTTKHPGDGMIAPAASTELRKEGSPISQQEDDDWGGFVG